MAVGILGAMGVIGGAADHLFVGELSLDGTLRPVRGILSIAVTEPLMLAPVDSRTVARRLHPSRTNRVTIRPPVNSKKAIQALQEFARCQSS